ncbi:MAG: transcription-repair coupling factor [Chloroflexi bacterium]|nr:transcription-repair coupling factor [Chloroflexota bacterium]
MEQHLSGLLDLARECKGYQTLLAQITAGNRSDSFNIVRSARPFLLAALANDWDGPVIYLTADVRRAYNVSEQLPLWLDDSARLNRFAEPSVLFYDRAPWDASVIRNRIDTLSALAFGGDRAHPIVVASARALMQATLPLQAFCAATIKLETGRRFQMESLILRWIGIGYEPAPVVIEPGTFSRRGGILDIYPLASDYPLRIEFFDDEIESLRLFDPGDQRSVKRVDSARIVPAREALPKLTPAVGAKLAKLSQTNSDGEAGATSLSADIESLCQGSAFAHLEHYLPLLFDERASLLNYAPDNALLLVEEPDFLEMTAQEIVETAEENRVDAMSTSQIWPDHPAPYQPWRALKPDIERLICLSLANIPVSEAARDFEPGERFGGQLRPMLNRVRQLRNRGDRAVIITEQVERLENLWYEQDASAYIPSVEVIEDAPPPGALRFVRGSAAEGWSLANDSGALHFITDAEIFGWSRPEPRRRSEAKGARARVAADTSYTDWAIGAHVVHVDFGIGRFMGMRHRTVHATEREYLLVEYQNADTIYVPIHQADRLSRYVGAEETPPKLNQLGKPDQWIKARDKAKRNAEEEAKELLQIYSRRAQASGIAFSPDSAWQHEMEAGFPFVETEDQLRVIHEVKADMHGRKPMDRLVCGDVGFGKTEVALRAAFKAVQDGAQVAVLVPTTVLAQQHYDNFMARLHAFPVVIEMLSRFRSKPQQKEIRDRLASGEVDIVIGTHRLLSKDIAFKQLGLMIIDEEQRFGVKHKEHFKKLRARIDILTLTATPIPRTLYLSLSGIRDISMIQSPPEERLPVITHVGSWDDKLARHAIMRELERGGQVFVVHNRVKSIHIIRNRIERIVPEASIAIAHGQMAPRALEKVMSEFTRGEYDILISTSIIENGIDMPRVNTLLVDRADFFGVAQLYQLRGRVGRSAQQAYAYFFYASGTLSQEARSRLETLAENTQLGAGFQIAIRDLEMRGSGDILSMRQSGHIASVGLHLYTEMLQQAVKDQKGGASAGDAAAAPASARERLIIDLPLPAYFPTDWIPEMALRLQLYRRIGDIKSIDEIELMRGELIDRFGPLPAAVEGLLYQIRVKVIAQAIRATHVLLPRAEVRIKLPFLATINRELLSLTLGEDVNVTRTDVRMRAEEGRWQERLLEILEALEDSIKLVGAFSP